jgi:hypothetical protein
MHDMVFQSVEDNEEEDIPVQEDWVLLLELLPLLWA